MDGALVARTAVGPSPLAAPSASRRVRCVSGRTCPRRACRCSVAGGEEEDGGARREARQTRTPSAPPRAVPLSRRGVVLAVGASSAALVGGVPAWREGSATSPLVAWAREDGDWSSNGLAEPEREGELEFVKTGSGAAYQKFVQRDDTGPAAKAGDAVEVDYVLRRPNGYFIYSTIEGVSFQPRDVPVAPLRVTLGNGSLIKGLDEVLQGMTPGSKRRAVIPARLGYVSDDLQPQPPTFATRRQLLNHKDEPLLFEVLMVRVNGRSK